MTNKDYGRSHRGPRYSETPPCRVLIKNVTITILILSQSSGHKNRASQAHLMGYFTTRKCHGYCRPNVIHSPWVSNTQIVHQKDSRENKKEIDSRLQSLINDIMDLLADNRLTINFSYFHDLLNNIVV